jgi:hypothetical protein
MRKDLAASQGERKRFKGLFVRVGKKINYNGHSEDTILLQNVTDLSENRIVADHVWFTFSKVFDDAGIREGDVIAFDARVKSYKKGYVNRALNMNKRKEDFKLSHPTKVEILEHDSKAK